MVERAIPYSRATPAWVTSPKGEPRREPQPSNAASPAARTGTATRQGREPSGRAPDFWRHRGAAAVRLCRCPDFLVKTVGARGFEPPTPRSRTECATRLRYAPSPALRLPWRALRTSGWTLWRARRTSSTRFRQCRLSPGHWHDTVLLQSSHLQEMTEKVLGRPFANSTSRVKYHCNQRFSYSTNRGSLPVTACPPQGVVR